MKFELPIAAFAVQSPGAAVDSGFVPAMMRRRLSPLQKLFFALAHAAGCGADGEIVFASRDGEDSLTRRLVDEFNLDGSVSPHRFSASVYNAAPGLWSVHAGNRSPYTAIAAGEDTVECGIIAACADGKARTLVYAEETGGGYGAAIRFGEGSRRIAVETSGGGDPIGFAALAEFLEGGVRELNGRWIRLRDLG